MNTVNYPTEFLAGSTFIYRSKAMTFEEVATALGQGGKPIEEQARVINKRLAFGDTHLRLQQPKQTREDKIVESIQQDIMIEDALEAMEEVAVIKQEERREQQYEERDQFHESKMLTLHDFHQANQLEDFLKESKYRHQRLMDPQSGSIVFIIQNIWDTDIQKISKKLARMEMGERANEMFRKGVGGASVGTKGIVQVAGKAVEGTASVVVSTGAQLVKSTLDAASTTFVSAKREARKQKMALASSPEALETGQALKSMMNGMKSRMGFGKSKQRGNWS